MNCIVYAMIGLPGSGKTTWVLKEREKIRMAGGSYAYISGDEIRRMLNFDEYAYDKRITDHLSCLLVEMANVFSEFYDVIFLDEALLTNTRDNRRILASTISPAEELSFVYMKTPVASCIARRCGSHKGKGAEYWERAIREHAAEFEEPIGKIQGCDLIVEE